MPRRASNAELPAAASGSRGRSLLRALRWTFICAVGLCVIVGCIWATVKVEHFVVADREFILQGPPEPGIPSDSFQIIGLKHASEQRVLDIFSRDFGRSIYLCPIAERRRRLLAMDWVRDATVSRVWPNRIVVRLEERAPIAFVQTPGLDGAMFYSLVDADGVLLDPQHAGEMALPVLSGFPANGSEQSRRDRIRRFLRLQVELGKLMDRISEIDVSDPDNLKLTQEFEGRALTLMVGNQKFLQRYNNFLENYTEIRRRLPDATILDLRLKDRITAVGMPEAHTQAEDPRR